MGIGEGVWRRPALALAVALVALAGCESPHGTSVDPQLALEIGRTKAIDNHAHPLRVTGANEKDDEYDALPVAMMEPSPMPVRLNPATGDYLPAMRALFHYRDADLSAGHVRQYLDDKRKAMRDKGDGYANWVLDEMGVDTMLANRVSMGRGLQAPRFRWVPFADALMYPLNNESLAKADPDRKAFFTGEEHLLARYLKEDNLAVLPPKFDDYLKFVTATLERQKRGGAVAEKFEAAYLRSLDFAAGPKVEADRVYSIFAGSALPTDSEYKELQDYLFRYMAGECGRLGMPVHIHTAAGAGGYFHVAGTSPLLLESVLNDPSLRKTQFVIIHGGWPFTKEAGALLTKPNVWVDCSTLAYLLYPHAIAEVLRGWLEFMPDKVLFGTDASPITPETGWEETGYMAASNNRVALGMALTDMMRDAEINHDRAMELARMVLRDNARRLYGW
ncbi:MAG: amidohydrolase family protein [Bryobacteraceae bacterium]